MSPCRPPALANPIGISTPAGEVEVRRQTLMRIGSSSTTMGVLLTKAESTAATNRVMRNDSAGESAHILPSRLPHGFQRPGFHQALAEDHQRTYGDERFVTETLEQLERFEARERKQRKAPD